MVTSLYDKTNVFMIFFFQIVVAMTTVEKQIRKGKSFFEKIRRCGYCLSETVVSYSIAYKNV